MKLWKKFIVMTIAVITLLFNSGLQNIHAETADSVKRSVVSIDAGRKYFSEEQLIQIIEKAYQNGYTSVQILLGNDGLRFVLDDMSLTVGDKTYESDAVKAGITKGNESYYNDPNGDVLTETEMNNIINYAKERDIDIIPVINSPGHMDAILVLMEELGLDNVRYTNGNKVSERTVNIENDEAIAFVYELVRVYAEYFGKSGASEIFNFGADEYANDVFTSPGWGELQKKGLYGKFVEYANDISTIIKDNGMLPMSFNDGIYYNSKDQYGTFDKDIIISYWTAGWWGFEVAKPELFAAKGHAILNTNDGWYWVLGRIDDDGYNFTNSMKNIDKIAFNVIPGNKTDESIGSMQAIWADDPSQDHGIDKIMQLMDAFSNKHRDMLIRPADYSALDAALETVPEDLTLYTDESLITLTDAQNSIIRNIRETEQERVNAMTQAVVDAVEGLILKKADYTRLNALVTKAKSLNVDHYLDFENVLTALSKVVENLDITRQSDVDAMADSLELALEELIAKKADYTNVDKAVKKANVLDAKKYTNFENVQKALDAVVRDLDVTEQDRVDTMAQSIEDAIKALTPVKGTTPPTGINAPTIGLTSLLGFSVLLALKLRKRNA